MESTQDTPPIAVKPDTTEIGTKRKVGRPGVTYEQISNAAFAIRASGQSVTAMAVREHLGTGSWGTIQPAVRRWNDENKPKVMLASPTLPDGLLREIGRELDRIAAEAKLEIKQELQDAQDTADKYADLVRSYEVEQETLNDRVESLTVERDQAVALAADRQQKIEQLAGFLAREQSAAESARIELAKEQLRTEATVVKVQDQADTIREKDMEIARLRGERDSERKAREKADLESAKLTAQFEAEKVAKTEAAKREADALAERDVAKSAAEAARAEAAAKVAEAKAAAEQRILDIQGKAAELEKALLAASSRAASEEAKCKMLADQVQDLKPRLDRSEASLEKAREVYMALAGKAPPSKPSQEASQEEEELLKPPSPPPIRKRSGAQLADRQT